MSSNSRDLLDELLARSWKTSGGGTKYLKIHGHVVSVREKRDSDKWGWRIIRDDDTDPEYAKDDYMSEEHAKRAALEELVKKIGRVR